MTEPTKREITRGVTLLREAYEDLNWEGPIAVIPVDEVCKWDHGDGPCERPLKNAIVLLCKGKKGVHVVAYCSHHTKCMEAATKAWREKN